MKEATLLINLQQEVGKHNKNISPYHPYEYDSLSFHCRMLSNHIFWSCRQTGFALIFWLILCAVMSDSYQQNFWKRWINEFFYNQWSAAVLLFISSIQIYTWIQHERWIIIKNSLTSDLTVLWQYYFQIYIDDGWTNSNIFVHACHPTSRENVWPVWHIATSLISPAFTLMKKIFRGRTDNLSPWRHPWCAKTTNWHCTTLPS